MLSWPRSAFQDFQTNIKGNAAAVFDEISEKKYMWDTSRSCPAEVVTPAEQVTTYSSQISFQEKPRNLNGVIMLYNKKNS